MKSIEKIGSRRGFNFVAACASIVRCCLSLMSTRRWAGPRFQALICSLLCTFFVDAADQLSSAIRVNPSINYVNVSWPCSMDFSSASLDFSSDSSSSLTRHNGTLSLSAQCCTGSELSCEWVVSPLLSGTMYHMTLVIFRQHISYTETAYSDPPSVYRVTTHTLSPLVALPPSLTFTCDSIHVSWLMASPLNFPYPLQSQRVIAILNGTGIGQGATALVDLPAAQSFARLPLPLPSVLSRASVQFAVISYFGASYDRIFINSSSLPSQHFNFSHSNSPVSDIATAAGMEAFADSTSVTVLFNNTPAFAYVALFLSSEFPSIGCNRSKSSVKISSAGYLRCSSCGFHKASRILFFEQLPPSTDWTVALCIPTTFPPTPCSDATSPLSAASTLFLRTSSNLQFDRPTVIGAFAITRGVRVCWRHKFSATSSWRVTFFINATSTVTVIKRPSDLIVEGCAVAVSCSICSDFDLDLDSFCSIKNNSNAVIVITLLQSFSFEPSNSSSSGYPMFSLCAPPPPTVAVCLMADVSNGNQGFVNISWPLEPISITHLLLTLYYSVDSRYTSVVHNLSVTVSPHFILLPLPLGISCCLVARSSINLNVFSQFSTPICGLQVNAMLIMNTDDYLILSEYRCLRTGRRPELLF